MVFFYGVEVVMAAIGTGVGALAIPSNPSALEQVVYPGIGTLAGVLVGVVLLWLFFTGKESVHQGVTNIVTNIVNQVSVHNSVTVNLPTTIYTGEALTKRVEKIDEHIERLDKIRWDVHPATRLNDVADASLRINRYMDWIQDWASESMPEYVDILTPDSGPMTNAEQMRFAPWIPENGKLMVMIDRQLTKLRQTKAILLRGTDR